MILRQVVQSLAIDNAQFAMAHIALSATFILSPTVGANGAIKNLEAVSNSTIHFLKPKCGFYVLEKAQSTICAVGTCAMVFVAL
jgi:hypothetical protein